MVQLLGASARWNDTFTSIRFVKPNEFENVLTHKTTEKEAEKSVPDDNATESTEDNSLQILKEEDKINGANEVKIQKSEFINKLRLESGEVITANAITTTGKSFAYATLKQETHCPLFIVNVNEDEKTFDQIPVFHKNFVSGLSFLQDGRELAACDRNGHIAIYEVATGACLGGRNFQGEEFWSITYMKCKFDRFLAAGTALHKVHTFKLVENKRTGDNIKIDNIKINPMGDSDEKEEEKQPSVDFELTLSPFLRGSKMIQRKGYFEAFAEPRCVIIFFSRSICNSFNIF